MHYGAKLPKKDKRNKKFAKQRKKRGFDDSETWSLDQTIARFILPRLKRFRELNNGYPHGLTFDEWCAILDQIIDGFQCTIQSEDLEFGSIADWKKINKRANDGLKLFVKHFRDLWW